MIEVNQLTKSYGRFQALKSISFTLNKGEVVGFLGPNGAGKTTTMRILTGFTPLSSGRCVVDGLDVETDGLHIRNKVGYLPETTPLYMDMEVSDYLTYMGQLRHLGSRLNERRKIVVEVCGLGRALGKKIGTLSKGYRQRVGLAQAMIHDPEILILDEPTVGLDPNQIVEIRNLIRQIGESKTILLSSHILSEVDETCSRVIIIADGRIAGQGTTQQLIEQTQLAATYRVQLKAPRKDIEENIGKMSGLKTWEFIPARSARAEEEWLELRVVFTSSIHPFLGGVEIFNMAVARRWVVRELHHEQKTLEDVFKEMTK